MIETQRVKRVSLIDKIIEASYHSARGQNVISLHRLASILRTYDYYEAPDGKSYLNNACIEPDASPYDFLLRVLDTKDIALLEAAGRATSEEQVRELLREYWDELHLRGGVLAKRYKLRVSGDRLLKVFGQVMSGEPGRLGD